MSHAKMLSVYKKHDPQTQILQSSAKDLSIGWIGCVSELNMISEAFEELKTDGLHITKTLNEVIHWVIDDQKLDDTVAEPHHSRQDTNTSGGKRKSQWRVSICLVSPVFDQGPKSASGELQPYQYRLVHPCYIIDFSFRF